MTPEGQVKKDLIGYLNGIRMMFLRLQSGEVRVRGGMMHLCPKGTADFLVCPQKGFRIGWIETKQLKGELRPAQEEFEAKVTELGHPVLLARSVDDVEQWLKKNGAI